MYRRGALFLALIISGAAHSPAYDLHQHTWRHRLLFLIAPSRDSPELVVQQRRIEQRRGALLDRDMRVFQLFSDQGHIDDRTLSLNTVIQLRTYLNVAADDRMLILIGKDGGIKRRTTLDTDLSEILQQIDAMPMRREEIREKKDAGMNVTDP